MTPNNQRTLLHRIILWTCWRTLFFEAITIALRFGARLESTRDTAPYLSWLTFGYRIHHSYVGVVLVGLAAIFADKLTELYRRLAFWLFVVGLSLIMSDLIHHFAVLWPLTGSPEFDLVYPKQ